MLGSMLLKVDVDENQDAAAEYQIQAVPTFVFYDRSTNEDAPINRFAGADPNQLESLTKELQDR